MTLTTCAQCGTHVSAGNPCPLCGTPTPAPAVMRYDSEAEVVLDQLRRAVAPKYQVRRILGYGGMAGVYLADEPRLGRQVAIKVMSPSLMADPSLVDRFGQEARTIAQLLHPNIVTIFEVDDRNGLHFFTMSYVAGRTLGQVLAEGTSPLPIDVARAWLHQIGDALGFAHERGVVHRDVKPGNVLLDPRGNALVTDFGIAKVADRDAGLTRTGVLVGTPAYMSPEQCQSGRVAGASDQYSLGVVAYQMITGQRPFEGPTLAVLQAHLSQEPRPVQDLRPDCPDDLAAAVERMLQKRPEARWPNLAAALAAAHTSPPGMDGSLREELQLLAVQATQLRIEPPVVEVREGTREQLRVQLLDETGRTLDRRRINWQSEIPTVGAVLPDNTLLATSPGRTRLDATCGAAFASIEVVVEADPVRELAVAPARASLPIDGRMMLEAIARDWDGTKLDDRAVLWSVSDVSMATVSPDGIVVGLMAGDVVVTAASGGCSATATVTITSDFAPPPPPSRSTRASVVSAVARGAGQLAPAQTSARSAAADRGQGQPSSTPTSRRTTLMVAAGLVVVGAAALLLWSARAKRGAGPATQAAASTVAPIPPTAPANQPAASVGESEGRSSPPAAADTAHAAPRPPARTQRAAETRVQPSTKSDAVNRTAAPLPPATAPVESIAAVPPARAVLELAGSTPPGASLMVKQPDGQTRSVSGRSMSLAPGDYVLEFSAPGYEDDRQTVHLAAGASHTWTPVVRAVAKAATSPAAPPPPAHDRAADLDAIGKAVRNFAAAFDKRDSRTVVPLLPSEVRKGFQELLESPSVDAFHAQLVKTLPPVITGDNATVDFTMRLNYRDADAKQDVPLHFTGTAVRDGSGWRLTSLRSNS